MLDFYLATITIDAAECDPDETMYIGSINLDQHSALQPILRICEGSGVRLPYFEDSVFSPAKAKVLLECLRSDQHRENLTANASAALVVLENIVRIIVDRQAGMRVFCD